ncbi:hypothetical protein [Burkholderia multivorans]|uniref:hypothetical protein n=1 Tax=Burkholderia multivorans TaxID=87883 RepID=UPI00209EC322|nr:hypothetical protein [Burkholderia multivorans]MCO8320397.1 hypothetical protein [Burkholderia multivorans]
MKLLTEQLLEFVSDNKIWAFSVAVPLLGAIPLYIYSMGVGELPDFSLGDLTGSLIASFLTEVAITVATVGYLLFAGFAARSVVNSFYPKTSLGIPVNHCYLIRGNFIQGVTVVCVLAWFGLTTSSFDTWLPPPEIWLARIAYWASLFSSALLVVADWRSGKRPLKYALFFTLTGSIAFLAVLVCAYLGGYIAPLPLRPGWRAPSPAPIAKASAWVLNAGTWLLHDHLIATAATAALAAGGIVSYIATITRVHRQANRSGQPPQLLFKSEGLKLLVAKACITAVFCFLSGVSIVFLGVMVDATPTHAQTAAAVLGGSFLIFLNWFAFAASDWKQRGWAWLATFFFVFVMLPLQSDNAMMLPRMVTNALGSGNRHATNLVLSSMECPALAPYGIDCKPDKDGSIGLTNVNILNRLGSTVLIELQVQRIMDTSTTDEEQRSGKPVADAHGLPRNRARLIPLTLRVPEAANGYADGFLASYKCDALRLEGLRAVDRAMADSVACVKLSLPKDHMLSHTVNGAATYRGGFSQYIQIAP